jgi:hypothetical protein
MLVLAGLIIAVLYWLDPSPFKLQRQPEESRLAKLETRLDLISADVSTLFIRTAVVPKMPEAEEVKPISVASSPQTVALNHGNTAANYIIGRPFYEINKAKKKKAKKKAKKKSRRK